MTSDVSGDRRPESLDGPGYDLATGSFEEMRVKVTFPIMASVSLQNINSNLSCLSTYPHDATWPGMVPHVRHLVHTDVKAEQLHSGPGATAWILVLRTCLQRDISCFGCLSRQGFWCHVFTKGKRTLPVAQKLRASSHAFPCTPNFDRTGAVVCDSTRAAACALA